jgi:hypothetical protein
MDNIQRLRKLDVKTGSKSGSSFMITFQMCTQIVLMFEGAGAYCAFDKVI